MCAKDKNRSGVVWSTDPAYEYKHEERIEENTLAPAQQELRVRRDSKMRAGKTVTLVEGFIGTTDDLESLGKILKSKCGAGGSVKDGTILVQGDFRERILQTLQQLGYKRTKTIGG